MRQIRRGFGSSLEMLGQINCIGILREVTAYGSWYSVWLTLILVFILKYY